VSDFRRASAIQDGMLFVILATPVAGEQLLQLLFALGSALGDERAHPSFSDASHALVLNLFGLMGVFFAWVRIRMPEACTEATIIVKLLAVLLFAIAVWRGAPLVLLLLLLMDFVAAIMHWRLLKKV
jgi:hypothetical protein